MILYLHGFNSSSASSKAALTAAYCNEVGVKCVVPDLSHQPAAAMDEAKSLCTASTDAVVAVGSSLGGYYATWLVENGWARHGVLINPAVAVAAKLKSEIGCEQENYTTGQRYMFTKRHVQELENFYVNTIADPRKYLLLLQQGDEVLDYKEAVAFYAGAQQVVEPGGDHSFIGFERYLERIVALTRQ